MIQKKKPVLSLKRPKPRLDGGESSAESTSLNENFTFRPTTAYIQQLERIRGHPVTPFPTSKIVTQNDMSVDNTDEECSEGESDDMNNEQTHRKWTPLPPTNITWRTLCMLNCAELMNQSLPSREPERTGGSCLMEVAEQPVTIKTQSPDDNCFELDDDFNCSFEDEQIIDALVQEELAATSIEELPTPSIIQQSTPINISVSLANMKQDKQSVSEQNTEPVVTSPDVYEIPSDDDLNVSLQDYESTSSREPTRAGSMAVPIMIMETQTPNDNHFRLEDNDFNCSFKDQQIIDTLVQVELEATAVEERPSSSIIQQSTPISTSVSLRQGRPSISVPREPVTASNGPEVYEIPSDDDLDVSLQDYERLDNEVDLFIKQSPDSSSSDELPPVNWMGQPVKHKPAKNSQSLWKPVITSSHSSSNLKHQRGKCNSRGSDSYGDSKHYSTYSHGQSMKQRNSSSSFSHGQPKQAASYVGPRQGSSSYRAYSQGGHTPHSSSFKSSEQHNVRVMSRDHEHRTLTSTPPQASSNAASSSQINCIALKICPMCSFEFPKRFTQEQADEHLALCLSFSDDCDWT